MADERWQRVKEIFGAALERPAGARQAYVRDACGGDEGLRREVESLLAAQSEAGKLLSEPARLESGLRPPALAPGRSLGVYQILGPLGAGGMGEVYRARDTHLGREVAIKVLPDAFGQDPDRLSRFAREARLLASLNHPNIAAIHGFEESDSTRFLIMELVPGETLAERLHVGPLPVKDALSYAQQIAEALEEAHAKGIVHRDLKPANVKVTASGKVKVLDFGLAKALAPESQTTDVAQSPTLTQTGAAIMGTAAYMSPEQARGKPVDKRADVWAFGCVLYEMLTGRPPFEGETVSDVIAAVLKHDPDWTLLPADTPIEIRDLLRRCTQKDAHRRLHDIADARIELEETLAGGPSPDGPTSPRTAPSQRREWLAWTLATLALVVAAAAVLSRRGTAQPEPISFVVNPPDNAAFAPTSDTVTPQFAISPDGRRLAFVAAGPDRNRMLWIRRLDAIAAVPVPRTDGAFYPFWSPDSRQIGFFANYKLKKVELGGALPQVLADVANNPRGGTWNSEGVILYSPNPNGGLFRVSAEGGTPSPVTAFDAAASDTSHRWPQFLPDGRHFLFLRRAAHPRQGIYVGSLDSKTLTQLNQEISSPTFAPPNHLLFARSGTLFAVPLDLGRLKIDDKPFAVVERIATSPSILYTGVSVAPAGVLAYASARGSTSRLEWFDRKGELLESVGEPGDYLNPRLSPDEKQIAVARLDPQTSSYDLWLLDRARRSALRFTFGPDNTRFPVWSPDGKTIAFSSLASRNVSDLAWKPTSGAAAQETFLAESEDFTKFPHDWSRDGRWIVYQRLNRPPAATDWDIYLYDTVERKPVPFLKERFNELHGQLSRDGHWMAYASDETGRYEVYVQPFPVSGAKWQVSTSGGSQPRWRGDGRELFYVTPDGKLMAVAVEGVASSFRAGVPQLLFATQMPSLEAQYDNNYSVTADGQRFLVNSLLASGASPLTVVVNWSAAPRRE